jgi:hypothetical protein
VCNTNSIAVTVANMFPCESPELFPSIPRGKGGEGREWQGKRWKGKRVEGEERRREWKGKRVEGEEKRVKGKGGILIYLYLWLRDKMKG